MDPDQKRFSLTLTIDKEQERVLFAQADKAFVDFIFNILFMPMGRSNVGCLPNIYKSFKDDYMVSNVEKQLLLNTKLAPLTTTTTTTTTMDRFYKCDACVGNTYLYSSVGDKCWRCEDRKRKLTPYIIKTDDHPLGDGFVKGGIAKYRVMDDLSITDFDPSSLLLLLKSMNVTSLDAVEERIVYVDIFKARILSDAALSSCNGVLTKVFLGAQRKKISCFEAPCTTNVHQ